MRLFPEYCDRDRYVQPGEEIAELYALDVDCPEGHLIGFTLTPNHRPGELHPAVIMLHGFPGHNSNHDLGQALRRVGFVVINPYAPGAWGSGGCYSFRGLVDAACAVAAWARDPEIAARYHIDVDNIFLFGHSMGGFTTINALPRLPWVKAAVAATPYDVGWYFERGRDKTDLADLLAEGSCLRVSPEKTLYESAKESYPEMAFSHAVDGLRGRNLYFLGALQDTLVPPAEMIEPIYLRLKKDAGGDTTLKYDVLDTNHSFQDRRMEFCRRVCSWLVEMAQK